MTDTQVLYALIGLVIGSMIGYPIGLIIAVGLIRLWDHLHDQDY